MNNIYKLIVFILCAAIVFFNIPADALAFRPMAHKVMVMTLSSETAGVSSTTPAINEYRNIPLIVDEVAEKSTFEKKGFFEKRIAGVFKNFQEITFYFSKPVLLIVTLIGCLGLTISSVFGEKTAVSYDVAKQQLSFNNQSDLLADSSKKDVSDLPYDERALIEQIAQGIISMINPKTGLPVSHMGQEPMKDWAFTYDVAFCARVLYHAGHEKEARRILDYFADRYGKYSAEQLVDKADVNGFYGIIGIYKAPFGPKKGQWVKGLVSAVSVKDNSDKGSAREWKI